TDAFHGSGMGRFNSFSLFHGPSRRAGQRCNGGSPQRILGIFGFSRSREAEQDSRSTGVENVRGFKTELERNRRAFANRGSGPVQVSPGISPNRIERSTSTALASCPGVGLRHCVALPAWPNG